MFVFIMVFAYFNVPKKYQPKILTWGILGAVAMRLVLIFVGVGLISAFAWIIYVFGAVLIYTAVKMFLQKEGEMNPGKNPVFKLLGKVMPLDMTDCSACFFIKKGVWHATPLFATLLVIETTDLIFAVDSIPAVLAISKERFIVYSSNVFAVVGLRSLYFFLAAIIDSFHYLKTGISIILFYVGLKMLASNFVHIPALLSLCVVLGILALSILLSILIKPKKETIPELGE
jgi:tellurite resistance protein TerC